MTDAMRSEFEAEYPLPENATFNGDVYIAPLPAEGMTAYNVRWDAWKRAWKDCAARMVPEGYKLVPVEPTPEMIYAMDCFDEMCFEQFGYGAEPSELYRAGVYAAPEPKP